MDALIVIDGIPARPGGIDRLNPNDIETISVLKMHLQGHFGARATKRSNRWLPKEVKEGKPELTLPVQPGFAQTLTAFQNGGCSTVWRSWMTWALMNSWGEWRAATDAPGHRNLHPPLMVKTEPLPLSPEALELTGQEQSRNYPKHGTVRRNFKNLVLLKWDTICS